MKTLIIILAGAVGLTGCMTTSHQRGADRTDAGFSSTYPGKSDESHPSGKPVKPGEPYIIDLPPEAQVALAKVGIKDIAFLAAVGFDGKMRLLKPENVRYAEGGLPVKKVKVKQLTPVSIMAFTGSPDCVVATDGSGKADSGGGVGFAAFCTPKKAWEDPAEFPF